MNNPITIGVADDCELFRYLIRKIIADSPEFHLVTEATNGKELIDKLERSFRLPQICILDIGMPIMDGYKTLEVISKRWPSIQVLVYSQFHHEYAIGTLIQLGAKGFIPKMENTELILEALTSIKENGYYYSKYAPREIFERISKGKVKLPEFTPIEKSLLALFCTDMQYNEIARQLYVSPHTIEKHKQNISRKTGINSREGLILFAIHNELYDLNTVNAYAPLRV